MKNLAPDIFRQRLLIEGYYTGEIAEETVRDYLLRVAEYLELRTYGDPVVNSTKGTGTEKNQGFDAFVPLVDSGIVAYIWTQARFFSIVIYSCKEFSDQQAVVFTHRFFGAQGELASEAF